MTLAEHRSKLLRDITQMEGWRVVIEEIESRQKEGWEKFIALPVDQKTSKASFHYQARYDELKSLVEWIQTTIEEGEKE